MKHVEIYMYVYMKYIHQLKGFFSRKYNKIFFLRFFLQAYLLISYVIIFTYCNTWIDTIYTIIV